MGDIADMILEGELCQECGVHMGEPVGYPRSCNSCRASVKQMVKCPHCNKRVKEAGLKDHIRDKHGAG